MIHSFLRLLSRWGALLALAGIVAGCSGSTNPLNALLHQNKSNASVNPAALLALMSASAQSYPAEGSVSGTIGASGGTLSTPSGSASLEIPAGALTQNVQITMNIDSNDANSFTGFAPATPKIRFEPEGLQFQKPVTLSLKYGTNSSGFSDFDGDLSAIYYYNGTSGKLEQLNTTRSGDYLTAQLQHFSLYSGLYLRIEDVVSGVITDPATIQGIAVQFKTYLIGMNRVTRRNYFYDLYQPTLLPFLIIVNGVYPAGANPIMNQFPNDDFDLDGIQNISDPYPFDPTNSGDTTPPSVVSVAPSGTNIPLSPGQVTVTFSESVSEPTLKYAAKITDGTSTYLLEYVSLDATGRIATYKYGFWLNSNTSYTVQMDGVTDIVYNKMSPNLTAGSFQSEDRTLPTIVSYTPSGTGAPLTTNQVTITFSETIDPTTLGSVQLIGIGNPVLSLAGMSPDGKTATFNIGSPLADSGYYFINPGTGIKDLVGNPLAIGPGFLLFQMEDHTPPMAYAVSPNGTGLVNPDAPSDIIVNFSEPVDPATVQNIITLSGGAVNNPSVSLVSMDSFNMQATYHVNGTLDQEMPYQILIGPGYKDAQGNAQNGQATFQFATADTIPPTVASISPADGANRIAFWSPLNIRIQFSEPMDQASVTSGITITDALGNIIPYAFVSYTPGVEEALYTIDSGNLSAYTGYTITMNPGVRDDSFNNLSGQSNFTFFTDLLTNPRVTAVQLDRCGGTGPYQIPVTFDRTMDYSQTVQSGGRMGLRKYYQYNWNVKRYTQISSHQETNWAKLACYKYAADLWYSWNFWGAIAVKSQCDGMPNTNTVPDYGYQIQPSVPVPGASVVTSVLPFANLTGSSFVYGSETEVQPAAVEPAYSRCDIILGVPSTCGGWFSPPYPCTKSPPVGTACYQSAQWAGYTKFVVGPPAQNAPAAFDFNDRSAVPSDWTILPSSLGQACY